MARLINETSRHVLVTERVTGPDPEGSGGTVLLAAPGDEIDEATARRLGLLGGPVPEGVKIEPVEPDPRQAQGHLDQLRTGEQFRDQHDQRVAAIAAQAAAWETQPAGVSEPVPGGATQGGLVDTSDPNRAEQLERAVESRPDPSPVDEVAADETAEALVAKHAPRARSGAGADADDGEEADPSPADDKRKPLARPRTAKAPSPRSS